MKVESIMNPALLTRIRRSHAHVSNKMRTERAATTNLFLFEYMDCSDVEVAPIYRRLWNFCMKVTVVATGERFIATQRMSFRENLWGLFRIMGGKG